ncbi:hypothetical protein BHM03_00054925 [Ensete ventricosum]|nr:hypothetical protein BHM03_00054925 [Ensete ventricosum]
MSNSSLLNGNRKYVVAMSLVPVATAYKLSAMMSAALPSPATLFSFSLYSLNRGDTKSCDVRGSYPQPPDAKLMPVSSSCASRCVPRCSPEGGVGIHGVKSIFIDGPCSQQRSLMEGGVWCSPRISEGFFPLENLPVALPPGKSLPYGGKLHLAKVGNTLLFPGSTIESPNTSNAGTFGVVLFAVVLRARTPSSSSSSSSGSGGSMRESGRGRLSSIPPVDGAVVQRLFLNARYSQSTLTSAFLPVY